MQHELPCALPYYSPLSSHLHKTCTPSNLSWRVFLRVSSDCVFREKFFHILHTPTPTPCQSRPVFQDFLTRIFRHLLLIYIFRIYFFLYFLIISFDFFFQNLFRFILCTFFTIIIVFPINLSITPISTGFQTSPSKKIFASCNLILFSCFSLLAQNLHLRKSGLACFLSCFFGIWFREILLHTFHSIHPYGLKNKLNPYFFWFSMAPFLSKITN